MYEQLTRYKDCCNPISVLNLERTNQSKLIKKENRKELEQSTVSSTQLVEGKTALLLISIIELQADSIEEVTRITKNQIAN